MKFFNSLSEKKNKKINFYNFLAKATFRSSISNIDGSTSPVLGFVASWSAAAKLQARGVCRTISTASSEVTPSASTFSLFRICLQITAKKIANFLNALNNTRFV